MVKPLTTDIRVWLILGFITLCLTVIFALCFYFFHISIAFVIGYTMLLITKRLLISYRLKSIRYATRLRKIMNISFIVFFWVVAIWFLYIYTVNEISSLIYDFQYPKTHLAKVFQENFLLLTGEGGDVNMILGFFSTPEAEHFFEDLHHVIVDSFLIIPLLFIFYFYKAPKWKEYMMQLVPVKYKTVAEKTFHSMTTDLEHYFMSKLRSANLIILLTAIGFYLIGLKGAFLVAMITGITSIIPHIGFLIGLSVSVFVAWIQSPLAGTEMVITDVTNKSGVVLFAGEIAKNDVLFTIPISTGDRIALTILAQVAVFLLYKLYFKKFFLSERIHLDPLLDIVLILIAAKLFGVLGMLFVIPIYCIYRVVLKEFYWALVGK